MHTDKISGNRFDPCFPCIYCVLQFLAFSSIMKVCLTPIQRLTSQRCIKPS